MNATAPSFTVPDAPSVSFEFFPPNTESMEETLWKSIQRLEDLDPHFGSVTYGADGSTRERTHNVVRRILDETSLLPAAHLTCVDASRAEIDEIARRYWERAGVDHKITLEIGPALDRAFESLSDFRCAFPVTTVELYHQAIDGVWRVVDSFPLGATVPAPPGR